MQLELPAGRAQVKALCIICCNGTRNEPAVAYRREDSLIFSNRRRCPAELCMMQTLQCYNTHPWLSMPVPSQFKRNTIFSSIHKKCVQRRMLVLPYVCVYVYVCMCVCVCMYLCVYVFMNVYVCIYLCVCMYVCIYVFIFLCV